MKPPLNLAGQKVTILGWARSGRPAARLAASHGARVFVSETKDRADFEAAALGELEEFDHELGGHTARALESDIIVLSPGIPPSVPILRNYRGRVWSELELGWRALSCRVVAITGTNGKTTTTTLVGEILSAGYAAGRTHVAGNIGRAVSAVASSAQPEDLCVIEISSFQLETIEEFRPEIAVYLNLRSDHLDRYASIEEYAEAKNRIFLNMTPADTAILNVGDAFTAKLADRLAPAGPRIVTVAGSGPADFTLTPRYDARLLDAVKAPENLLSAVAVAHQLAIPEPALFEVLDRFTGLPHRIEPVGSIGRVAFYNDSKATNVHSVEAALNRLDPPIVLLMGGRDKGEDYGEILGLVKSRCRSVVAYGEAAERIHGALGGEVVPAFEPAVRRAYELARPDASVLLSPACSSYDQFRDYAHRGESFRGIFVALKREEDGRRER